MQDKSEKPSQRKLKKAKERGEGAYSSELIAASLFVASILLLWIFSEKLIQRFGKLFAMYGQELDPLVALKKSFLLFATLMLVLMSALFCVALLLHFFQKGWVWNRQKPGRKSRGGQLFLPLKILVVAVISYFFLMHTSFKSPLSFHTTEAMVFFIFKKIFHLLLSLAAGLLLVGIADFIYQKWKHYKEMHMTPQEMKEEKRETEGANQTKRRR